MADHQGYGSCISLFFQLIPMQLNLIVAIGRNREIGQDGDMPWKRGLPADLGHFKSTTMGYPIIMGRHTFESFPKGALPGRRNIIITRNRDYTQPNTEVVHSLEEAIDAVRDAGQAFIIGGGQVFEEAMPRVETLYITVVEHYFPEADTFFPEIDPDRWECIERDEHPADDRNRYPYTFTTWRRKR